MERLQKIAEGISRVGAIVGGALLLIASITICVGRAVTQLMEVLDTLDEALERQEARGSQASGPSGQT